MKKSAFIVSLALIPVLIFSLVGCGGNPTKSAQQTTLEKARKQGYITVGFANEKPYAYATPNGKLTGESVEVARTILKNLGIKEMNGVLTEFGSLIPGLNAHRFDIITAGMFITPARAKEAAFANPDYQMGEAIAVKAGNPYNLHSYKDIAANPKVKVGVMAGGIENNYLTGSGVKTSQIVTVPDQPSALAALQAGRVNVITMTGPSLLAILKAANDSKIEEVQNFTQPVINGKSIVGYGAAVFRKSDTDFRKAYNEELAKLEKSGQLLKIIEPFGFTKDNLPKGITVKQVLQKQS